VAPLQRRSHPMWEFTGVRDSTRLRNGCLTVEELDRCVNQLLGGTQGALWLMDDLQLLYERDEDARIQILSKMPACDTRGPLAASSGQPDLARSEGPTRHRKLMLPSDSKDEAQDWVPLAERMRQAPLVLHRSSALLSVPSPEAGTSTIAAGAGEMPGVPSTSS
jgi:hypothetical protein